MITPAETSQQNPHQPLTRCTGCGEPLYAGFPMRTVPGGAMHVGCYVLANGRPKARRHLELVVDNSCGHHGSIDRNGLEPAA